MAAAVILPAEIGGQPYRLTFKFGSMRIAEVELGRPITAELASGQIGLDVLSCLFWAVLQPAHRMTREGSDDLIDAAGIEAVGKWIGEGLGRYFNDGELPVEGAPAQGEREGKGKPRPAS
jgi:hypothetical protein